MNKNSRQSVFYSKNIGDLAKIAAELLVFISDCKIIGFQGDLGAGKTTFIQSICALMGCKNIASSPTYSIINEYKSNSGKIYHMDLYRLQTIEEALDIGIEDYLYSGNYVFIEWPDLILPILEGHHIVKISTIDNSNRKIVFL